MRTNPGSVVESDEVGVLFELYDFPQGREHYSVEVLLAGADGLSDVLPVRAAGEREFLEGWEGSSRRERPVTQFLILDVSGVEPGSYTVSVAATLPEAAGRAMSETRLIIR